MTVDRGSVRRMPARSDQPTSDAMPAESVEPPEFDPRDPTGGAQWRERLSAHQRATDELAERLGLNLPLHRQPRETLHLQVPVAVKRMLKELQRELEDAGF